MVNHSFGLLHHSCALRLESTGLVCADSRVVNLIEVVILLLVFIRRTVGFVLNLCSSGRICQKGINRSVNCNLQSTDSLFLLLNHRQVAWPMSSYNIRDCLSSIHTLYVVQFGLGFIQFFFSRRYRVLIWSLIFCQIFLSLIFNTWEDNSLNKANKILFFFMQGSGMKFISGGNKKVISEAGGIIFQMFNNYYWNWQGFLVNFLGARVYKRILYSWGLLYVISL